MFFQFILISFQIKYDFSYLTEIKFQINTSIINHKPPQKMCF